MIGYLFFVPKVLLHLKKFLQNIDNCPKIALFEFRILSSNTSEANWWNTEVTPVHQSLDNTIIAAVCSIKFLPILKL